MSLRSHSNAGDQPRAPMASPGRSANGNRLELPRHGPEAEISLVKPICRISSWHFATINAPYRTFPSEQVPPAIARTLSRFRAARLTAPPVLASTTVSRGPSRPCSIAEQKASQSLPALQAPAPSRGGSRPRDDRPEVLFRSACAFDLCQPCGWALYEARQGRRSPDPAPDAGSRSRHHPSMRISRRQRLCLPSWAPRWFPLKRPTPPWTFGQGWTHAVGWRCEFQD